MPDRDQPNNAQQLVAPGLVQFCMPRINPVSEKRRIQNKIRHHLRNQLVAERGFACEIGLAGICSGGFTDMHEILSRARGGSIIDPNNILLVCRSCHSWITQNPQAAADLGVSRSANQSEAEFAEIRRQRLPEWKKRLENGEA